MTDALAARPSDPTRPDSPQAGSPHAAEHELRRLLDLMAALRDPATGCPWDQAQDFASIAPYTIEEAYEVADAIARRDWDELPGELGDLLFQVVFHARMAEEAGRFAFADVARAVTDKMRARHPHVFGPDRTLAPGAWERHKAAERARNAQARAARPPGTQAPGAQDQDARPADAHPPSATLAGVPLPLPALTRAAKLTARAARVGFDWPDAAAVLAKLDEEVAELRAELPAADPARLADELGDMLFVLANLARKLDLDPETCLRGANAKFTRRFAAVEAALARRGLAPAEAGLPAMEAAWHAAKAEERRAPGAPPGAPSGALGADERR